MVKAWTGNPLVQTRYGAVKGFAEQSNTLAWKGIPYAKPPVGALRWKAPVDPNSWTGILEAANFSEMPCQPQLSDFLKTTGNIVGSEDCLYLNIWRPQSDEKDLPVYFWIHGGGNVIQGPELKITHGANIASQSNVVFVSINYRLGQLGWLSHPALRTGKQGSEYDDSGNYGILDIIKALQWVQDNIEAFGGSPDNVFVNGESAGAFNTLVLIISPAAKHLFHKAMAQSGAPSVHSVEKGDASTNATIAHLLIRDKKAANLMEAEKYRKNMTLKEIAAYLRSKSYAEIYAACSSPDLGLFSLTSSVSFADGAVVPLAGFDTLKAGTYPNKVPLILGTTCEELKLLSLIDNTLADDKNLYKNLIVGNDLWKASGVDGLLRTLRMNADQPDVFGYQFCWGARRPDGKSPFQEQLASKFGAFHSMDIPFFFNLNRVYGPLNKYIFTEKNQPGREALSRAMMEYVAQFIRTGNPNKPDVGITSTLWQPWSNEVSGPKCIIFDVDGDVPDIRMTTEELTMEDVRAKIAALSEALQTRLEKAMPLFDGLWEQLERQN